ncbi:MAG: ABC transporter ATP-binding protein [Lachnospiraceae bacterium]|nr:ABC transporter ATP-binding protein [Lachnospiraceae bacterium]
MEALLEVQNLSVTFAEGGHQKTAVDHISFTVKKGEILGVVGESGSGKSMTALTVMGIQPEDAKVSGRILFQGKELLSLSEEERNQIRGNGLGMVFQEPMTSLNPVLKVGMQVAESLKLHTNLPSDEIRERTLETLRRVGLSDAEGIYDKYPHELSGGMRQRAMLAMAMIHTPSLLIADEPTTALDVLVQAQILELIRTLHQERQISVLFISHDLKVIRQVCDRVLVMRGGRILEEGTVKKVFETPEHAYTKKLVGASVERTGDFRTEKTVLSVRNLNVHYKNRALLPGRNQGKKQVLSDVSFDVREGEIFGIVGESGCGKSTLARTITGLHKEYEGQIVTGGETGPQMVFQDPFGSLNPARTIGWILEEPLKVRGIRSRAERKQMVTEMLQDIGLDASFAKRYPRELSGGQRQRISIGLALSMNARLLIADEPVSALDITIQAQILELLLKINREKKTAILFITHDLSLVRRICHRAAVLYEGKILEIGDGREICDHPKAEYTRQLLAAALDENRMAEMK